MCRLSKNLKLCSCETDIEKLKHYWVVHRKKSKGEIENFIIGMADLPVFLEKDIEIHNDTLLLHLLNETEVFDTPLHFKNNDRLQLSFLLKTGEYLNYGFTYRRGQWHAKEYDGLEWSWYNQEQETGKIKDVFEK